MPWAFLTRHELQGWTMSDGVLKAEPDFGPSAAPDPFFGRMTDPTGSAFVVGLCGDEMEFYLYKWKSISVL